MNLTRTFSPWLRIVSSLLALGLCTHSAALGFTTSALRTDASSEQEKGRTGKNEEREALIAKVRRATDAKNWQEVVALLEQLIALDSVTWQYYSALGDAHFNLGHFDQAVEAYEKGIQVAERNPAPDSKNPENNATTNSAIGKMLIREGNAYLKLHKNKEAIQAYTKAARIDPNPGVAYFNLCATLYNAGEIESGLEACDKAIAFDPNKADAFYIKGVLLFADSKTDESGKLIVPPGTAEVLHKYLQLAPDGPHAKDAKEMLDLIGSKADTTYKKRR